MRIAVSSLLLLCLIGAPALLLTAQSPPVSITATAPNGQVNPGSTVSIPMSMTSTAAAGTSALQVSVAIPPEISSLSATAGTSALAASKNIACATGANGVMTCVLYGMNANQIANGTVANLQAQVSPATLATSTTLTFSSPYAASPAGDNQGVAGISPASFQIAQAPQVAITSLVCTPSSLASGQSSTCTVTLNQILTANLEVVLASDNAALSIPVHVTVLSGLSSSTFGATAGTITTAGTATLTATINGSIATFTIQLAPPTLSRCDINQDGRTDSADAGLAESQVLGRSVCGTADLNGDGKCTVVDLQNVINASLGQACRTAF